MMTLVDRPRRVLLFVIAGCAVLLGIAFGTQHIMGVEPCTLCVYQRIPYAVVGAVALSALALRIGPRWIAIALILCALGFLAESAIAVFHLGVEQKWWIWESECTGYLPVTDDIEAMKRALMAAEQPRCDEVNWAIFGLSVTVYNTAIGFAAALGCVITLLRMGKRNA